MKKLLSLPPNLVECFHDITGCDPAEWFCAHDPVGRKLGSGGGTAWLLLKALAGCPSAEGRLQPGDLQRALDRLPQEKRILIHAGGQSRRLPAYAPSGKILTPLPVFRWERGQRLSQDLLQLQLPLYERIMAAAPARLHTMVVSGDVYIRATQPLQPIPEADVVCYGLWLGPEIAKDHGVFVSSRQRPSELECMLQKPTPAALGRLLKDHYYLTDTGVWLLSDRAVRVLMEHAVAHDRVTDYDLYGTFGCCLGTRPTVHDAAVAQLSVAVLPLPGGEFYHFGTSHELLSSTLAIQNLVNDQRRIMHHSRKPHPAIFVQNALAECRLTESNVNIWIENSHVGPGWTLSRENIVTGVPRNDWALTLEPGQCVDLVPMGEAHWAVRSYRYDDRFDGNLQQKPLFPVAESVEAAGQLLACMLGQDRSAEARARFEQAPKVSAEQISARANLRRLTAQRTRLRAEAWPRLALNYEHSIFYQLDLADAAREFARHHMAEPPAIDARAPLMTRIHDAMFRSELARLNSSDGQGGLAQEERAFALLREGLAAPTPADGPTTALSTGTTAMLEAPAAGRRVATDQIVWARSPVRIDIAGGWTDTPPYCLMEGGSVINLAIELNGQPPIQTYVKPCAEPHIILRSIDLGATETVTTYEELADCDRVGSPFSIPKAALTLAGFGRGRQPAGHATLRDHLRAFGSGIELTLLSAIPAGSGLGTSSVLAATVLGALSDFCALGWDKQTIGRRTLELEQMLTTGGGWQDQFGGLLHGVKLLQTQPGFEQTPSVRWLPDGLFTQPEYRSCHLLYYTGIRRTAKTILSEIVRRMFLNQHDELILLREMKAHTMEMYESIQRQDFEAVGRLVRTTWKQNQMLDSGTNPDECRRLTQLVDDLCLGYKLPGAGGGGYLYMMAKDPEAAARIKAIVDEHPLRPNARFVDMSLSRHGLQVSRS